MNDRMILAEIVTFVLCMLVVISCVARLALIHRENKEMKASAILWVISAVMFAWTVAMVVNLIGRWYA